MPTAVLDSRHLTREECVELLDTRSFGRVGLNVGALPTVMPVHYARDGDRLVLGIPAESRITNATNDAVLALQVDNHDEGTDAWSVLVRGRSVVHDASDPEIGKQGSLAPPGAESAPFKFVSLQLDVVDGTQWHDRRPEPASP